MTQRITAHAHIAVIQSGLEATQMGAGFAINARANAADAPTARDVTHLVRFGDVYDESLPIARCVCGERFPRWDFIISIYPDSPKECPKCGRKFYFSASVKVFEVV
jgi:hypothetical protein